jgi:hypothetical protein
MPPISAFPYSVGYFTGFIVLYTVLHLLPADQRYAILICTVIQQYITKKQHYFVPCNGVLHLWYIYSLYTWFFPCVGAILLSHTDKKITLTQTNFNQKFISTYLILDPKHIHWNILIVFLDQIFWLYLVCLSIYILFFILYLYTDYICLFYYFFLI